MFYFVILSKLLIDALDRYLTNVTLFKLFPTINAAPMATRIEKNSRFYRISLHTG